MSEKKPVVYSGREACVILKLKTRNQPQAELEKRRELIRQAVLKRDHSNGGKPSS